MKSNYCRNKTYFHKNSANKMSFPIKKDSHEKDLKKKKKNAFSACNYIHNKLHLHVCAW